MQPFEKELEDIEKTSMETVSDIKIETLQYTAQLEKIRNDINCSFNETLNKQYHYAHKTYDLLLQLQHLYKIYLYLLTLASERQNQVLSKMVKYGYITEAKKKEILNQTQTYHEYFNKK